MTARQRRPFAIPVGRVYASVFGLGAGLAALGGVLIVPIQQAHYLMGHDPLLLSFIVVIIGGLGSLPGTVVAALLIGISDGMISVFFAHPRQDHRHPRGGLRSGVSPAARSESARYDGYAEIWALHLGIIALLFVLQFILPPIIMAALPGSWC